MIAILLAAVLGAVALFAFGHPKIAVILLVVAGVAVGAYYLMRREKRK